MGSSTGLAPISVAAAISRVRQSSGCCPIVGRGEGVFSFLHVDDAGSAAVCALERGAGVYNIVDDEPVPCREWIPAFCAELGAPPPWRVPGWLVTIAAGRFASETLQSSRGATNAKAKREMGWSPRHQTW